MKNNFSKKLMCFLLMLVLCISTVGYAFADSEGTGSKTPDDGVMRDGLTAMQVSEEMGVGINLGNTLEAYWLDGAIETGNWLTEGRIDSGAQTIGGDTPYNYETCWGAVYTTQQAVNGMKAAGFNTIRIPVYWGNMMENDGTFTINPEYIARVKEVVDYARNAGMYVVINIHHYDEFLIRRYVESGTLAECAETFTCLWTQIAEYFKDYSDYLVFEGYNEYLGGGAYERDADGNVVKDQWGNKKVNNLTDSEAYLWTNTLNQAFVDAVRATGGNNADRILIASGYWTNIDNTTSDKFIVPEDSAEGKIMVSVHYVDNAMYWTNKIGSSEWEEYSIDQCEKLKEAFSDKGIPVFVGECTSIYTSDRYSASATEKDSSKTLDYMLRLIKSYGFIPVLWDTNNNFYSRTDAKIKSDSDAAVILKLAEELGTDIPTMEELEAVQENISDTPADSDDTEGTTPTQAAGVTGTDAPADDTTNNTVSYVIILAVVVAVAVVGVAVVKKK
ncbi:MAG: glycoside hydrolase family 5 protein [Lachnospiraceae bacterium]